MTAVFKSKKGKQTDGPLTREGLCQWLVEHLAARIGADPATIDTARSFDDYGLDSRVAVQVSGALEKVVERRLSPSLLYEYRTIDDLSSHLSSELNLTPGA